MISTGLHPDRGMLIHEMLDNFIVPYYLCLHILKQNLLLSVINLGLAPRFKAMDSPHLELL